jgi:hypothetical protein
LGRNHASPPSHRSPRPVHASRRRAVSGREAREGAFQHEVR